MTRTNNSHIMPTIMTPLPDRETFEREVHELFTNGDINTLARYLGTAQSTISKQFNPYTDEKHNPIYEFLRILWAMDALRDGLADTVLHIVIREREKWLGEGVVPPASGPKLTANIAREFSEFLESELSGETFDEQIAECVDIVVAAEKKKAQLIAARNHKHFGIKTNGRAR